jgi:hypothetical protein
MTKGAKIALISLAVLGTAGLVTGIVLSKKKKAKEKKKQEDREQKTQEEEHEKEVRTEGTGATKTGYIVPVRNRNGEVVNPLSEVKGKMLYPASDSSKTVLGYEGGAGSATLRTEAEVNTGYINNRINKYSGREAIGTVTSAKKDNLDPAMRWFKVKMKKPCCGYFSDYTEGWVRADVVTFNKYKKKTSSMEGDMIEHYAPMPLGANVFPHSNWMLPADPQDQYYSGMDGNNFELEQTLNDLY